MGEHIEILTGFEPTHIVGSGKDVLDMTRHTECYEEDLRSVAEAGIKGLRYAIPWHKAERVKGEYDWVWVDRAMSVVKDLGLDPIIDTMHHVSFPDWLKGGFADPEFISRYKKFVVAVLARYPWVNRITLLNEAYFTSFFAGYQGVWAPYSKSDEIFVRMILNVSRVCSELSLILKQIKPTLEIVHVETCEKHCANDGEESVLRHVEHCNTRRFVVMDLIRGKFVPGHPLFDTYLRYGMKDEDWVGLAKQPGVIDTLGLDYYSHNKLEYDRNGRLPINQRTEGYSSMAMEYAERYGLDLMCTETNIRGFVTDRLAWFRYMVLECMRLRDRLQEKGLKFKGLTWYPWIDSTDWGGEPTIDGYGLLTKAVGHVDPVGVLWLDDSVAWDHPNRLIRHRSELSEVVGLYARKEISWEEIPDYAFQPPLDEKLRHLFPLMESPANIEEDSHRLRPAV